MRCDKEMMLLYAVTDRAWVGPRTLYQQVEAALKGGVTCVQLREKELDDQAFLDEAKEIAALCRRYKVPFFINDNVEIAIKCGADGIHVGQQDMCVKEVRKLVGNNMMIGVSVHTVEEALEAVKNGADCIGVGAMFSTSTKTDASIVTMEMLKAICDVVDVPVVAIGGINKSNISQFAGTGVHGVALVSAIFAAQDIENESRILRHLSDKMMNSTRMRTVLTIAGSDCSGGAGIQADLKTLIANGVYGMSAITAMTAQNTKGVRAVEEASPEFLKQQIDAVFEDIYPDAVKIGMVSSKELICVIAERLRYYGAENVVVDPVMVASSGSALMKDGTLRTLIDKLIPLATLVTPNISEAQVLSGMRIKNKEDMMNVTKQLGESFKCAILLKGGHSTCDANDLLYMNGEFVWFEGERINNPNNHGTGCTLSSAIAANLAKGFTLEESIKRAKNYVEGALEDMLDLGKGAGPLNHAYKIGDCSA